MKLTTEELSTVIAQQKNSLKEQEEEEEDGAGEVKWVGSGVQKKCRSSAEVEQR